jgi:hypothetical protein
MLKGIKCSHCGNMIPYNMVNAVLSDACPFCGFAFASESPGLKECYSDLVDMLPALGSLDFATIKSIVQFVFNPDFEQHRDTMSKHLDTLGDIFNLNVVEEDEIKALPVPPEKPAPPPDRMVKSERPVKEPKAPKATKTGTRKPPAKIKTYGTPRSYQVGTDLDEPLEIRPAIPTPSGAVLSSEAIESLPEQFRARAREVKTDEDLKSLMHDVAFSGLEDEDLG